MFNEWASGLKNNQELVRTAASRPKHSTVRRGSLVLRRVDADEPHRHGAPGNGDAHGVCVDDASDRVRAGDPGRQSGSGVARARGVPGVGVRPAVGAPVVPGVVPLAGLEDRVGARSPRSAAGEEEDVAGEQPSAAVRSATTRHHPDAVGTSRSPRGCGRARRRPAERSRPPPTLAVRRGGRPVAPNVGMVETVLKTGRATGLPDRTRQCGITTPAPATPELGPAS